MLALACHDCDQVVGWASSVVLQWSDKVFEELNEKVESYAGLVFHFRCASLRQVKVSEQRMLRVDGQEENTTTLRNISTVLQSQSDNTNKHKATRTSTTLHPCYPSPILSERSS